MADQLLRILELSTLVHWLEVDMIVDDVLCDPYNVRRPDQGHLDGDLLRKFDLHMPIRDPRFQTYAPP